MKLSIVMPIYNAEKYLEECIDSILPEMREDVELLLIDDGSTDSSYHIMRLMRRYEKSNIRILHHENRGVSYTRNRGIQEAQGKYIMFVDADDRMLQGWSQPALEACACLDDVIYFSNGLSGKKINKENIFNSIFQVPDSESIKYMTSPWSRLYRLAFLQEHNILFRQDIMYGEDALFNLDVILQARRFSCVGKSIYQYRHYESSSSRRYSPKFFESSLAYIASAEKMLTGHVSDPEIERYIGNSFVYNVYLSLFFISNISDYRQRKAALKIFQDPRMCSLFHRFTSKTDCRAYVKWIYWLVKHGMMKCAWLCMEMISIFRKCLRKEMTWETI